jgi:hypothetical protein
MNAMPDSPSNSRGAAGVGRLKNGRPLPLFRLVRPKYSHRGLPVACFVFLASVACGAPAHDAQTRFAVTATVEAVARVVTQSAPSHVVVSATDVERGFVDVAEPMRLRVSANSPGCVLDIVTVAPMLSSLVLKGLGSDQRLEATGGTVVERWTPRGIQPSTADLVLHFRLMLAPQIAPGSYPWPLRVFVRPVESPAA